MACSWDGNGQPVAHYGHFEMRSAFQPIFRLGRRAAEIYGFEGLVRVFAHGGKKLSPLRFFPLVQDADRLEVETLCRELHMRSMQRFESVDAVLFANFDPSAYGDRVTTEREIARMQRMANEVGVAPGHIVCEITEKRAPSEGSLRFLVDRLRAAGYRIALDDYGADDSDVQRIETIEPDIVKFDAAWIGRLMETEAGYGLLATMVQQFHDRGIETLFEGLEERWQLELAEEMGVRYAQGFILARPELAPADFAEFFATDRDAFKLSDAPLPTSHRPLAMPREFENEEQYDGDVLARLKRQSFGRRAG